MDDYGQDEFGYGPEFYTAEEAQQPVNYDPSHPDHKGTIDRSGQVWVWPVDNFGRPHHSTFAAPGIINDDDRADFVMMRGRVYGQGSYGDEYAPGNPEYREAVRKAVPEIQGFPKEYTGGLADIINRPSVPLPDTVKIGSGSASWDREPDGRAWIYLEGHREDRQYAREVLVSHLEYHGIELFSFNMEDAQLQKTADWNDVMNKAKRINQSGQVMILRNGSQYIVANVQGDHGSYEVEIQRQDPNSRVITGWSCFLPDAPVTLHDGTRKAISEVVVGNHVITKDGNSQRVTNVWSKPYEGKITRIKLKGHDQEVIATSDHKVYAANEDFYLQRLTGWRGKNKRGTVPRFDGSSAAMYRPVPVIPETGWKEIGELHPKDYLSVTQSQDTKSLSVHCVGSLGKTNSNNDGRFIGVDASCDVEIDKEIAFLLGWYAAEGTCTKSNLNQVKWTLFKEELDIADKLNEIVERRFGVSGTVRYPKDTNVIEFQVSHYAVRQICEQLVGYNRNDRSAHKQFSAGVLSLPPEIQHELMMAWSTGDGCDDGNRRSITASNEHLTHQGLHILHRLGIVASHTWTDENFGGSVIANPENCKRHHRLRWSFGPGPAQPGRFIDGGHTWYQIESVIHEEYSGEVWDIEVEGDHSFQAYGVNVHNCECQWSQYAFDRTRKWKKYESRPCSHVLAAYWKSLGTPLDDGGAAGDDGMPAGPGQAQGPPGGPSSDLGGAKPNGAGGEQPVGVREPAGGQRSFSPDEPPGGPAPAAPNMPQGPSPVEQTPRAPSTGVIPPNPMDQMQQWQNWGGPGTTDGGQDSPPWAVSVPGAKPQSPFNPMQQPGTYSRVVWSADFNNGDMIRLNEDDWGQAAGPVPGQYGDGEWRMVPRNSVGEVIDQDETTGWIQAIFPCPTSGPHEPYHVTMYLDPSQVNASGVQAPGPVGPRRLG